MRTLAQLRKEIFVSRLAIGLCLLALVTASPATAQARGTTQRQSRTTPGQNDAASMNARQGRTLHHRMSARHAIR